MPFRSGFDATWPVFVFGNVGDCMNREYSAYTFRHGRLNNDIVDIFCFRIGKGRDTSFRASVTNTLNACVEAKFVESMVLTGRSWILRMSCNGANPNRKIRAWLFLLTKPCHGRSSAYHYHAEYDTCRRN